MGVSIYLIFEIMECLLFTTLFFRFSFIRGAFIIVTKSSNFLRISDIFMQQLELNKDNLEGNTIPVCYDQERELQFMVNIIRCRYYCMFHWLRRFRSYRKLLQKKNKFLVWKFPWIRLAIFNSNESTLVLSFGFDCGFNSDAQLPWVLLIYVVLVGYLFVIDD